jgi:DNA repair photolyase
MQVIYQPKGRALEYSELACNLYIGCSHGCTYCFAPACMHKKNDAYHSEVMPRKRIIDLFEKDAKLMQGDPRRILFSFISDPYQPLEKTEMLTQRALELVGKYQLNSQILTKGKKDLIERDFELIKRVKAELGVTLCFADDARRKEWEPDASSVEDRISLLKDAHKEGIYTWVSLEPVIDAQEALEVIKLAYPYVRFWKIGKLNHRKEVEKLTDWSQFLRDVKKLLTKVKAKYYIKWDLQKYG